MQIHYIKNCLHHWFTFPKNKLYCQVATIGSNGPHIRTMDLYDINKEGHLVFLTDTSTRKWSDLRTCQKISVCMLNLDHAQVIVEGIALLATSTSDYDIVSIYWNTFLDQYWRDYYSMQSFGKHHLIPESFGLIIIKPYAWDILEINKVDFLKSTRKQFHLIDGTWKEE